MLQQILPHHWHSKMKTKLHIIILKMILYESYLPPLVFLQVLLLQLQMLNYHSKKTKLIRYSIKKEHFKKTFTSNAAVRAIFLSFLASSSSRVT